MRIVPYLLSEVFWAVALTCFCMIGLKYTPTRTVGEIFSKKSAKTWDSTQRPIIVGQLSDIHLNSRVGESTNRLTRALNQLSYLSTDVVMITGDLVDNKKDDYAIGDQFEPDWVFYRQCLNAANLTYKVLDITGNHDEYGLAKFSSNRHYILNYSRYLSERSLGLKDFWVMKYQTEIYGRTLEIISVNPLKYPTPHAKFGYYIYPTREMMDHIEAELANKTDADFRILQCHFPLALWSSFVKSSNGKTIVDLLRIGGVGLVVTGHTHPDAPWLLHSDGNLEIVALDLRYHNGSALITIDNGRYVYHGFTTDTVPAAVVTHPVPKAQLSTETVFNEENTEIRVLVFSDTIRNISVYGDVEGTMKCDDKNGLRLCSLPMNLKRSPQTRKIHFTGDWEHEMEFVIGDSAVLGKEVIYERPNYLTTTYVALALLWLILFVINLPVTPPKFAISANKWILKEDNKSHWLTCVLLGPLVMKSRIHTLGKVPQTFLFIATLWPLCLPLMFMSVEGSFGIVWTWGYVLQNKFCFEYWGPAFALFYLLTVVCPATVFASGLSVWPNQFLPTVWNVLVYLVGLAMTAFTNWYVVVEAVDVVGSVTSPGYVIIPVVLMAMFGLLIARKAKPQEELDLTTNPLLD